MTGLGAPLWFTVAFALAFALVNILFACENLNNYLVNGIAGANLILTLTAFGTGIFGAAKLFLPLVTFLLAEMGAIKDSEGNNRLACNLLGF